MNFAVGTLRFYPVSARDHRHGSVHKLVEPVGNVPRPGSDHSLDRPIADFAPLANFYGIVIMRVPIGFQEYPLDDLGRRDGSQVLALLLRERGQRLQFGSEPLEQGPGVGQVHAVVLS